jgi:hypothetical protein
MKAAIGGLPRPLFSNGAIYCDLNNDGKQDLITNNINDEAFIYQNTASEDSPANFLNVKFKGDKQNLNGIGTMVRNLLQ